MAEEGEPIGVIELEENLSDIQKPPDVPNGFYAGEIQDVSIEVSQKGNEYFAITFRIPPTELPPDVVESYEDGAVFYWNRQLVPRGRDRRALYNLRRFLESIGLDSNTTAIDPNEWMGAKARLRIGSGRYQGETRAELKGIEPLEEAVASKKRRGK